MSSKQFQNVNIRGFDDYKSKGLSSYENEKLFKKCRSLADSLELVDCSMGMSSDWEETIEAGSLG